MKTLRAFTTAMLCTSCITLLTPAQTTSPAVQSYSLEGVQVGMTRQVALATAKRLATGSILSGDPIHFDMPRFHVAIQTNSKGLVDAYSFCGLQEVQAGSKGPAFDLAVKSFGPPNVKAPKGDVDAEWKTINGVTADFMIDEYENAGGCIQVFRTGHAIPS